MELFHFTDIVNRGNILKNGISAFTKYEVMTPIRENVVFCWLKKEDNKIFMQNQICFKVNVNTDRCLIAEMDYISMAMMYKYGEQMENVIKKPINIEASNLLVKLYEITAVKPHNYSDGMFFSPEVLVKGNIHISCLELCDI